MGVVKPEFKIENIAKQVARQLYYDGSNNYLEIAKTLMPLVKQVIAEGHIFVHDEVIRILLREDTDEPTRDSQRNAVYPKTGGRRRRC